MISTATAAAHPNIAFIKYWGNQDDDLRIPANGSISMNLAPLQTTTTVSFDPDLNKDQLVINNKTGDETALHRVSNLLDRVRIQADIRTFASVKSENNFPTGSGIASSASAFAALALAATTSVGLELSEKTLSQLARTGSGSASRSIPEGFVEWFAGEDHSSSYANTIAGPDHWTLVDLVVLVSKEHKQVISSEGHRLANSSPLQTARVLDSKRRLDLCRKAILEKDFFEFAEIVEQDSSLMHSVMMTSDPPLFYWEPGTLEIIKAVRSWRMAGLPVCSTIDAGPNVHVISPAESADEVKRKLGSLVDVNSLLECIPGGPAWLLEPEISEV
jgi:diphosphomevalonate decarboxylase